MPDPSPTEPKFRECRWTNSDGLQLYYRDYPGSADPDKGGRPPILCLHGLTRNSRDFADIAERYAGEFRVIALDFRGRGNSDRDPIAARYVPNIYANDVIELLDHLGIDKAIFFGTSLGGLVTMIVAALRGERIAGSILNDIGPDIDPEGLRRIGSYVGTRASFADWNAASAYAEALSGSVPARFGPGDWMRVARQLCREQDGEVVLDYDMHIADAFKVEPSETPFDMWPLFRALAAKPVLVLRGELSDLLTAGTAERMIGAGSDVEVVTVPGVGHAPWLDEPEVTAALDRFLQRWR
jgi:pimeloyl-ACP methyl ester carboxylesterase